MTSLPSFLFIRRELLIAASHGDGEERVQVGKVLDAARGTEGARASHSRCRDGPAAWVGSRLVWLSGRNPHQKALELPILRILTQ